MGDEEELERAAIVGEDGKIWGEIGLKVCRKTYRLSVVNCRDWEHDIKSNRVYIAKELLPAVIRMLSRHVEGEDGTEADKG